MYFAFGKQESCVKESTENFLQNTSLVIYVQALLDKLELGAKASRVDKRSGRAAYDAAVTAVARRYACSPTNNVSTKTVVPIQGDGNCLFSSVRSALLWLVCHIRNRIDPAQYEICDVYKMIVAVVKSDQTGHHFLRQYACDALEKEFLDTTMPGDKRIEIADVSLVSLRDKIIASLEDISETIVEDVRIVTQNDLIAFIQKMRVDKAYGDITMLLTLQLMLSHYAGIVKCQVVHGSLREENLVPLV